MTVTVTKYVIQFKLNNGDIRFFNEDLPYLVIDPIDATKYDSKDAANGISQRLIGLPIVIQRKFSREVTS